MIKSSMCNWGLLVLLLLMPCRYCYWHAVNSLLFIILRVDKYYLFFFVLLNEIMCCSSVYGYAMCKWVSVLYFFFISILFFVQFREIKRNVHRDTQVKTRQMKKQSEHCIHCSWKRQSTQRLTEWLASWLADRPTRSHLHMWTLIYAHIALKYKQ